MKKSNDNYYQLDLSTEDRGAILILVAVIIVSMLSCAGLAIDVWKLLLSSEQAQQAADSAAAAGVAVLNRSNGSLATEQQWSNVKKAIMSTISESQIHGLQIAISDRGAEGGSSSREVFGTGRSTAPDVLGYRHDTADLENLRVRVTRGLYCYTAAPALRRIWVDLEGGRYWCKAKAVKVELTVSGLESFMMRAIVGARQSSVYTVATANLANGCGLPTCASLGFDDNGRATSAASTC